MRLSIYMKSGSVIQLRGIKEWKVTVNDTQVIELLLTYHRWHFGKRLVMTSIILSQIEAITKG